MIIHQVKQLSEEWHRLRLGIPTASKFDKIMTPGGKLSASSADYLHELLAEWMLDRPLEEKIETREMERGRNLEEQAVKSYEFETDRETEKVGFITTDDGMIGCSPDRLVGSDGLFESKCPGAKGHARYMLTRSVDRDYWVQLQGQLFVAERVWDQIQSYYPDLPSVVVHVERDDAYIALLDKALREFVEKLLAARADLESRYGPFRRAAEPAVEYDFGLTDEDVEAIVRERFPLGEQPDATFITDAATEKLP